MWFHYSRAAAWAIVGILAFALGWTESVTLVLIASLYANIVGDVGAAEAADDREVCNRLDRIEALLEQRSSDA